MFRDFFCDGTFECDQGEDEDDCGNDWVESRYILGDYAQVVSYIARGFFAS